MKKSDGNNEGNVFLYIFKKKFSMKIFVNIVVICLLFISKNVGIVNIVKLSKLICIMCLLLILLFNLLKYSVSGIISVIVIEIINKFVVFLILSIWVR